MQPVAKYYAIVTIFFFLFFYFNILPAHRYTFVDILRAILLSLEAMIEDPELQVNGFVLIIDWSNFTFKQASKLTPSMLRLAIEGLQVQCFIYCWMFDF